MLNFLILAARRSAEAASSSPGGKGMSISWAIVLFLIAIGLAITLSPPRRTYEVKKPKDE